MIKWLFDFDPKKWCLPQTNGISIILLFIQMLSSPIGHLQNRNHFLSVLVGKWWELTEMMVDILQG